MNKNILMIYPEIPHTYWGFQYAVEFVGKKAALPPLGLLTVAALLPPEYEINLIDLNVSPLKREDVLAADMVFISAMIVQKDSFREVVRLANDLGKPVVAGGPYPISLYDRIEGVDHFVLDEAELTLPVFLRDLEQGCPQKIYRDERKPDIRETPAPRFDLIDVNLYQGMALQYSRGCPYNCEFCDIIEMFGRKQRTKTPEQFVREMEVVLKTGFTGPIFVVDDNFVGNKAKVKKLLEAMIEWQAANRYPFTFNTEASIDLAADDELLDLMVRAGFNSVFVGVETPDAESLRAINKLQNLKTDVAASICKLQRRGIEVTGGFIVGFDTDTDNIFDRQIEFITNAAIPLAMVGLLMVGPNTQLYRRLKREKRWVTEPSGNNTHELHVNFETRMPEDVLIDGYKRVLREIYSPKRYFGRCLALLRRLPNNRPHPRAVELGHIRALLRSLTRQTFSNYGLHYLWYIVRALFVNFKSFPAAVTMAVMGHHFFLITREILQADEFSSLLEEAKEKFLLRREVAWAKKRPQLVHEVVSYVVSTKNALWKEYRKLSTGVQQHLREAVAEFEGFCEGILRELNQLTAGSSRA